MKKTLVLLLALLMALSTVAFASNNASLVNTDPNSIKVANELVTLTALIRGNPAKYEANENWFFKFTERALNVKLDYEAVDSSVFREKLVILMSTGSMPDLVMASATTSTGDTMTWGMMDELLLPIDEYAEYAPRYFAEIAKQPDLVTVTTSPDGHTYGFSNIRVVNAGALMHIYPAINQEWLDRLGLDMPTTTDEFFNVLMAFKNEDANGDGDPTNEVPWQASYNSGYPERMVINWMYGMAGYRWDCVDSTTHQGYFSPYHPRYKEALAFHKKLYDNGLFQETYMSGDNASNTAYGQTHLDYTYYGFSVDMMTGSGLTGNRDLWYSYMPAIACVADETVTRNQWMGLPIDTFTWLINADTAYPEVAVKFLDTFYDPYFAILYQQGPEYGTEYDYDGLGWVCENNDGKLVYPCREDPNSEWYNVDVRDKALSIMDGANFGLEGSTAYTYYFENYDPLAGMSEGERKWRETYAKNVNPYGMMQAFDAIVFNEEEQEIFNTYKGPLQNYMMAQEALFVTGERDWSEFDDYMAELDAMGGQIFDDMLGRATANFYGIEYEERY